MITDPLFYAIAIPGVLITGIAKGSGMIEPEMATMLSFLATDARVAPGLLRNERHYVVFTILSSSVCFALGGLVAYLGVIPLALGFLTELSAGTGVTAQFDIGYYIGFVLRLLVAFGAVFELPVLTFFLTRVGVVTPERMRRGRRYAIVVGFALAALLTPPDPISQMMMALPLVLLYEISIGVSRWAEPGR